MLKAQGSRLKARDPKRRFEANMMFLTFQTISTIETILTKNVHVRLCGSVAILIGNIDSIHNSEFHPPCPL